jgi:dihydroorotase
MTRTLLTGGTVVTGGAATRAELLIEDGRVTAIEPTLPRTEGARVVDVSGQIVLPGFVDLHVHFRQPGREDKETIATGAEASRRGGFVAVCPMPNTDPVVDHQGAVRWLMEEAKRVGLVDVLPIGALTKGQLGEELTNFGELFDAGCVGLSDDGKPLADSLMMRRALEYSKVFDRPVIQHAEDPSLSAGGCVHEGYTAMVLGLKGIPAESETTIVARDLALAELTGGWLHVAHVSCARSVELIRQAKRRGVRVTCEATPHHIMLTDEAIAGFNTDAKVNPPLRGEQDRLALIEGLRDGTIDCIATDHAPHTEWEKDADFDGAPFGIAGLETALGVCATTLVSTGALTWPQLAEKLSTNPARIAAYDGQGIAVGRPANITLVDPNAEWTVDPLQFQTKARRSPFSGRTLRGRVVGVMYRGVLQQFSQ